LTSSSEPVATILSPSTATAVAIGLPRSMVAIFFATKTVTGVIARPEASVSLSEPSASAGTTASATNAPVVAAAAARKN